MKYNAIVSFLMLTFFSAPAMTEFGIMVTKDHYAVNLKASVYNEVVFKKQFDEYVDFLKQTKEKDLFIVNILEQHFKQVMKQDCIELDRAQNDLNAWQESIKNEYFFKDTNKGLALLGIACGGLSIGMGYLLFQCIKDGVTSEGVLEAFLAVPSVASVLMSAVLLQQGWNYTKPLQDAIVVAKERIKALNANYAYWLTNKEKLNN